MPKPRWRDLWQQITAEAERAKELLIRKRADGEEEFRSLLEKHGEDGMVLLMRGQAYEHIGEFLSAFSDYRQAESIFPMQEWKESAREAAAKLESRLPSHARKAIMKAGLDSLKLPEEILRLAQEAFRFADLSPALSISAARSTLVSIVRRMGAQNQNPRGALAQNFLEQATKNLEVAGKISEVTAHEMNTIRILRNCVEYRNRNVTTYDAQACTHLLLAILKALFPS